MDNLLDDVQALILLFDRLKGRGNSPVPTPVTVDDNVLAILIIGALLSSKIDDVSSGTDRGRPPDNYYQELGEHQKRVEAILGRLRIK